MATAVVAASHHDLASARAAVASRIVVGISDRHIFRRSPRSTINEPCANGSDLLATRVVSASRDRSSPQIDDRRSTTHPSATTTIVGEGRERRRQSACRHRRRGRDRDRGRGRQAAAATASVGVAHSRPLVVARRALIRASARALVRRPATRTPARRPLIMLHDRRRSPPLVAARPPFARTNQRHPAAAAAVAVLTIGDLGDRHFGTRRRQRSVADADLQSSSGLDDDDRQIGSATRQHNDRCLKGDDSEHVKSGRARESERCATTLVNHLKRRRSCRDDGHRAT